MADDERRFDYIAIDPSGRRTKGSIAARSDQGAFERLRRDGLSPVRLRPARQASSKTEGEPAHPPSDRLIAEFLSDLSALLKAGADMRAALGVLGARSAQPAICTLCRTLAAEIGGGGALDHAFARNLGRKHDFVAALVAAGEASGDLAGGLQRAAEMLESRIDLRDKLVSILSYPAFVFASTIVAVAVILLFVVPSLAPLAEDGGARPPLSLAVMIAASDFLRTNALILAALAAGSVIALAVAGRTGWLSSVADRILLNGPARRTAGGLVFGAFSIALGNMLAAGAPMSDALRLAIRSVRSAGARGRLEPVAQAVRQGQSISEALGRVPGLPPAIIRLAAVGEVSGALGVMLARAGKLEEEDAIRRIEASGRILGPALIVGLGGMVGLLMASLLSGVSQLGQAALQ